MTKLTLKHSDIEPLMEALTYQVEEVEGTHSIVCHAILDGDIIATAHATSFIRDHYNYEQGVEVAKQKAKRAAVGRLHSYENHRLKRIKSELPPASFDVVHIAQIAWEASRVSIYSNQRPSWDELGELDKLSLLNEVTDVINSDKGYVQLFEESVAHAQHKQLEVQYKSWDHLPTNEKYRLQLVHRITNTYLGK